MAQNILGLPPAQKSAIQQAADFILPLALAQGSHAAKTVSSIGLTGSVSLADLLGVLTERPGMYLVLVYAVASVSTLGVLTVAVNWNDGRASQGSNVISGVSLSALGPPATALAVIERTAGSAVTYSTTVTGTLTYDLYLTAVKL